MKNEPKKKKVKGVSNQEKGKNVKRLKICFNDPNSDTQLKPQNGFKSNLETIYFQFYCLWGESRTKSRTNA